MQVLSLFDGMSCGQIALNRVGIKYENYFASEIDKYAITVTQANFPNTIQLGDITKINPKDLPKIDLIIGGSPCQGFSFAGKQLNFEDERSKLFFEYVRLLNELKPKYFLLENVRMKQEFEDVISKYMNIQPIKINSNLVSAQNRNRLYWTNIYSESDGLFGDLVCKIPQPKDKGILLKDILESEVDEKYFLSEKMINYILEPNKSHFAIKLATNQPKAFPLTTAQDKRAGTTNYLEIAQFESFTVRKNVGATFTKNQKTATLMARGPGDDSGGGTYLSLLAGDFRYDEGFRPRKNGKTGTLKARDRADESCGQIAKIDTKFRRLTPIECERLQTVPDNYTNYVSDSQRYKMLGNGWTVDVIAHIFEYMEI
jgi:DNA (cytosine-5)-methyltransferase 3A